MHHHHQLRYHHKPQHRYSTTVTQAIRNSSPQLYPLRQLRQQEEEEEEEQEQEEEEEEEQEEEEWRSHPPHLPPTVTFPAFISVVGFYHALSTYDVSCSALYFPLILGYP